MATVIDDTQLRLLDAAGQVFAERGFKAGTIRQICDRAGVNLAAVNYYFRDKERLYAEAVKHACRGRIEQVPLPEWPADMPAVERLRSFIHVALERMIGEGKAWHTQLLLRELTQPTAACAEWVSEYIRPMSDVLQSILAELLPPDTPVLKRYLVAFSIVGQCFHYKVNRPIIEQLLGSEQATKLDRREIANHIADFTLAALGLARPLSRRQP